jgi:hypothetical protein
MSEYPFARSGSSQRIGITAWDAHAADRERQNCTDKTTAKLQTLLELLLVEARVGALSLKSADGVAVPKHLQLPYPCSFAVQDPRHPRPTLLSDAVGMPSISRGEPGIERLRRDHAFRNLAPATTGEPLGRIIGGHSAAHRVRPLLADASFPLIR